MAMIIQISFSNEIKEGLSVPRKTNLCTFSAEWFSIWSGKAGNAIDNTKAGAFASNGFGAFSPDGYSMSSAFIAEFVLTLFFLLVILGATDKCANTNFCGIAIGLALTLIHLISIPITNTSVNPARSLSQAIFAESHYHKFGYSGSRQY